MASTHPDIPSLAPLASRGRNLPRVAFLVLLAATTTLAGSGLHAAVATREVEPTGVGREGRARTRLPAPTLALHPPVLALRDGDTEGRLTLHVRDRRGRPLDLSQRRVRFSTDDPDLVRIDADGTVHATGFGHARVQATVAGVPGVAVATVRAGVSRLDPPVLYLDPEGPASDQRLTWLAFRADGTPVDPAELELTWTCTACDEAVRMVEAGRFRALRPARSFHDVAVAKAFTADRANQDSALVVALQRPLPSTPVSLPGRRTLFFTPPRLGKLDYLDTWERFQAGRVADLAHEILTELTGRAAGDGDPLVLAHGVGQVQELWQCGSASSPIWLGTLSLLGTVGRSCFVDPETRAPDWGVYFHEMGHVFTPGSRRYQQGFAMTRAPDDPYLSFYGEDFASLQATFVGAMLRRRAREYGLPRRIVRSVLRHWAVYWKDTETLDAYVEEGARYLEMPGGPGGIFRGILWTLAQEYGWGAIYRFHSLFLPVNAEFSFTALDDVERATFFAAAMSAATGDDLLARFRDEWGFPIDENLHRRMLREMVPAAALRDPIVDAGRDRSVAAGETLRLEDADARDWEGDRIRYRWRIVEAPPGSAPSLRGARRRRPRFRAETPGTYVLALTAGDDLLQATDTIRLRVTAAR